MTTTENTNTPGDTTSERNSRRTLRGSVISTAMDKTITVRVERKYKHAKYGKYVRSHKKYLAHDEEGKVREGAVVIIESTRPLSKRKRWRLLEVVSTGALNEESLPGSDVTAILEGEQ